MINNISSYSQDAGIKLNNGAKAKLRNNIVSNNNKGISILNGAPNSDYNLFWRNDIDLLGLSYGENDVAADPMFVKDTIPSSDLNFDYHLQKYSPAIDAGDPDILDRDGSRSDIGLFGGPLGEIYTYKDLAPKPPANVTAVYENKLIQLSWNKNTEADFSYYRIYRDTVQNFTYDSTKTISTTSDTTYEDNLPVNITAKNYYYLITAFDSSNNQSAPSEEIHIIITGMNEVPPAVVEEYKLLPNYSNPFNPSTKIPYRLKEAGYVKLMVYNILGELMRVLVNEYQPAGYYEVEFSPSILEKIKGKIGKKEIEFETGYYGDIVSGIYLYRIEVIGEGKIPRFSEMRKMMLVK